MPRQLPASLTRTVVEEALEDAMLFDHAPIGFCIGCGAEQDEVEPDAERYLCDSCDRHTVYGAEIVLAMIERQEKA
jgi:hypothetical protein